MKLSTLYGLFFIIAIVIIFKYGFKKVEKKVTEFLNYSVYVSKELHNISMNNDLVINIETDRIIAHAGGSIEGFIYTNSLEALNSNYKKGIRYFELDINKTRDKEFVAVHDWQEWKKMTGYDGEIPPTLKDFKSHKIYKKYTPLTLKNIDKWFSAHPDAIFVTDKIKNVDSLLLDFKNKDRVIMELFSLDEVNKGISRGINVMPNWDVFKNFEDDSIYNLIKKLNIKYMVAENKIIYSKKKLLKRLSNIIKISTIDDISKKK